MFVSFCVYVFVCVCVSLPTGKNKDNVRQSVTAAVARLWVEGKINYSPTSLLHSPTVEYRLIQQPGWKYAQTNFVYDPVSDTGRTIGVVLYGKN